MLLLRIQDIVDDRLCYKKVRELVGRSAFVARTAKAIHINGMATTIVVNIATAINVKVVKNILTIGLIQFFKVIINL